MSSPGGTMDSRTVVKALHEVDPGFVALCDTLFGKQVDAADVWEFIYTPDGISKMSPGMSDLHVPTAIKAAKGILVPKPIQAAGPKPLVAKVTAPKKPNPMIAKDE